jgi:serine acetyltransferase
MKFGRVKISDNVYIGARVILMPGVTVGQNCIIGAGSIVTKDIPDNSLAVGSPARVIKTTSEYAEKLLAQMPEYNMQLLKEDRRKGIEEFIHLYNEKNKGIDHDKE